MHILYTSVQIAIYVLMGLIVLAAMASVTVANIFHAALCLIGVLIGIAGIYIALHAEFLAMVQILLYVGAVMTLIIYAIMLTHRVDGTQTPAKNQLSIVALFPAGILFLILIRFLDRPDWPVKAQTAFTKVSVTQLGAALMGPYVFPFEIISVVLIAVLIGALIIAKQDRESNA